jgi:hypothetical protein
MRGRTPLLVALVALVVLLLPALARAQAGLGLDLSDPNAKPAAKKAASPGALGLDLSDNDDFTKGPRVVAVPMRRGDGKPDLETFRPIFAALKEKLGARLGGEAETLKALEAEGLKTPAFLTSTTLTRLAVAVSAERAIVFDVINKKIQAKVYERFDRAAAAQLSFAYPKKMDMAKARALVADLLHAGREALLPPQPGAAVAEAPKPVAQEALHDVDEETSRERHGGGVARSARTGPMQAPIVVVLAGGGTTLRAFRATTSLPIVPYAQGPMPAVGFDLAFYPLRISSSLGKTFLADLSLEGHYRRTIAGAKVWGGADDGTKCAVDDDEVFARVSYRYPLPGKYSPRIGVSYAWTSERTLMHCAQALSTRYRTNEFHLKILEPILGEQLQVEVSGGPRFLLSERAAGYGANSFSVEGWLTGRPHDLFFVRAGARYTHTRIRNVPQGIPLRDERTFIGVEIGASI